jgi:hypothetical protein
MVGETKLNEFSSLCNDRLTSTPAVRFAQIADVLEAVPNASARPEAEARAPRNEGLSKPPQDYFVGSGVSFTVSQFLSARLMFSLSFLRHSVVQYFV